MTICSSQINGMDLISKLPNELSTQVFSYFDVFELARFESVSKSWYSIIRTNSTLWRDDGFDRQAIDFCSFTYDQFNEQALGLCSFQHQQKYEAMLERSGGKLDKIFLPFYMKCSVQNRIESLVSHLPTSNVKDLWIVMKWDSICLQHRTYGGANVTYDRFCYAVEAVLKAVVHCDHLKSLRLVLTEDVDLNVKSFGDPAKWPFSTNRLKKLALHNIKYDLLFPCEEVYRTILEAEDIEIGTIFASKNILPFISTAKATLKRCHARCSLDSSKSVAAMPSTYVFPQLEKLFLTVVDEADFHEVGETQVARHDLECPNLKVLHAPSKIPAQMIEQILCEKLEELCISNLPDKEDEMQVRIGILQKLEKCTNLKKLMFYKMFDSTDIKDICARLRKAPLEEITVEFVSPYVIQEVKQVVKDRLNDESLAKIKKVTIIKFADWEQVEIAWIQKHVPKVVLYSTNRRNQYREFESGLHPFERT